MYFVGLLKLFGEEVSVYILPKKNISRIGIEWSRIIRRIIESPFASLKAHFLRNLSESGYLYKRRFGGIIRQRREDRQSMAILCIDFLHNLFFIRVQR